MSDHRYTLRRDLGDGDGDLIWVMLNPSTADETNDDPTIRRVKSFTRREGFRRLVVVNLFAQRSTKPNALVEPPAEIRDLNAVVIADAMAHAKGVIFAWGATIPRRLLAPAINMTGVATYHAMRYGLTPMCLGKTANGSPRHPLYVKDNKPLEVY